MSEKISHNQIKEIFAEALALDETQRAKYLDEVCQNQSDLRNEVESLLESFAKSEEFIEKPVFEVDKIFVQDEHWEKVSDILDQVLEKTEVERSEFLNQVCGNDKELLAEVASLLNADTDTKKFRNKVGFEFSNLFSAQELPQNKIIGNYKILKIIGKGGMGIVYLAAREDEQFRQRVAIKLIKRGLDTEEVLRRFRNERQILASLHHPHIAQLLDGGTSEDGLPYFVMEYIEGESLLQYCDEKELLIKERLDLFKTICSAVQHAHQNLVIHRDLKPNNIIVTHEGEPKLLDFGVAKFLNPELMGDLSQTQTQFRVMTPEYASPEQIKGSHITTASDIYSLGVILYELLTGERPFKFDGKNLEQIFQTVSQSEPIAPSLAISRKFPTGETNQKSKIKNQKSLSGDLDNIVLMALRKEPSRRYKSVDQFAEDIQRHLKGLPVIARPNTFSYRTEKFVKRNLLASVIGALLILSLVSGIGISLWLANIARKESIKSAKINAFLQKTFVGAPFEEKGKDLKFAEVLDTASNRAETELTDEPEVKAQVLTTLGRTYLRLGLLDKAEEKAIAVVELIKQQNGEVSSPTAVAYLDLGTAKLLKGNLDGAEELIGKAVEIERKVSPKGSQLLGITLNQLAEIQVRKAKLNESIAILEEALPINRIYFGEVSSIIASNYVGLGRANERLGKLEAAERYFRNGLNIFRQLPPTSRFDSATNLLGLGSVLSKSGKFEESEKVLLEAQVIFKDVTGANSMPLAEMQNYLLGLYYFKGEFSKLEQLGKENLKMFIDNGGKDTNGYFATIEQYGVGLVKIRKNEEGERFIRESLEKRLKTAIPDDWRIFNTKNLLGVCLTEANKFDEAEKLFLESKEFFARTYGESDYRTIETNKYLQILNQKKVQSKN